MRIGQGYDIHRLAPDRPLVLGGVSIPFGQGLVGHSDADVLIHAVCDACLGAMGLGDIGRHFPDTDAQYAGIDSRKLLREVYKLMGQKELCISNLDATIIAETPKLAPFIPEMLDNLAADLQTSAVNLNIKATTNEGLDGLGQNLGIAAHVVVLLEDDEQYA